MYVYRKMATIERRALSHSCPMYAYRKMDPIERSACIIANRLSHSCPMHAYRKMDPIERRACIIANRLSHSCLTKCMHIARWTHRPTYIRILVPSQMYAYRTMNTSTDVHTYFKHLTTCMHIARWTHRPTYIRSCFRTLPNVCISHDGHIDRRTYVS